MPGHACHAGLVDKGHADIEAVVLSAVLSHYEGYEFLSLRKWEDIGFSVGGQDQVTR